MAVPRKSDNGFNWRPPTALKEQLRESARRNGRTLNAELIHAVREYLRPQYRR